MKFLLNATLLVGAFAAVQVDQPLTAVHEAEYTGPITKQGPDSPGCEGYSEATGGRNANGGRSDPKCCSAEYYEDLAQWRDPNKTNAYTCASEHLAAPPQGMDIEAENGTQVLYVSTMTFKGSLSLRKDVTRNHLLSVFAAEQNKTLAAENRPQILIGDVDCRAEKYCSESASYTAAPINQALTAGERAEQADFLCDLYAECSYKMVEMQAVLAQSQGSNAGFQVAPASIVSINGCGRKKVVSNDTFEKVKTEILQFHAQYCAKIETSEDTSLEIWQIMLIVLASLLGLGALVMLGYFIYRKQKVSRANRAQDQARYKETDDSPRNQDTVEHEDLDL